MRCPVCDMVDEHEEECPERHVAAEDCSRELSALVANFVSDQFEKIITTTKEKLKHGKA